MRIFAPYITSFALLMAGAAQAATTQAEVRDQVFISVQNGLSSAAGQALVQAGARIAAGSEALAALLRERQDIIDAMKPLQTELSAYVTTSGSIAEAKTDEISTEIARSKRRIEALDARLALEFPDYKELINPSALSIAEVQELLTEDEALIMTLTSTYYVFVWAISKTESDWTRAEITEEDLSVRIKTLRSMLSAQGGERSGVALDDSFVASVAPFDMALSHSLYQLLLKPVEHVFKDASHVMTVTDGPLTSLPFSVFIDRAPNGANDNANDLRAADWLIKRYALTTLPNVSSLRVLRRLPEKTRSTGDSIPFIGFGAPVLGYQKQGSLDGSSGEGIISRGVYDDVTRVADLTPLPNTSKELQALAEVMGADGSALYLGDAATETNVKSVDLSKAEVLAFATHGLLTGGLPGLEEPALVFTPPNSPSSLDDALLTASEAAQLDLSADLIILSACDTAGSDGTPGAEGLSGLARAFIYAGARSILVSHWPVDDYAASVLTTQMLGEMYSDDPSGPAKALQASILAVMNDDSDPRLAHPRIWAPFVVVGEGG